MAAYRRVYDSRHTQADCQETGSAPEPCATFTFLKSYSSIRSATTVEPKPQVGDCNHRAGRYLLFRDLQRLHVVTDDLQLLFQLSDLPTTTIHHVHCQHAAALDRPELKRKVCRASASWLSIDGTDRRTDGRTDIRPLYRDAFRILCGQRQ